MTEVSFSYSIDQPNLKPSQTEQLWSFNSVEILPYSAGAVTLLDTRSNKGLLVQSEVAQALSHCSQFRTLDSHLDNIFSAMPPLRDTPDDARNILNGIKELVFWSPTLRLGVASLMTQLLISQPPRSYLFSHATERRRSRDY